PTGEQLTRREFAARLAAFASATCLMPILNACGPTAPSSPAAEPAKSSAAPAAPASPAAAPAAPAAPAASPAAAGQPVPGGTLRTTLQAEPNSIDPHRPITTVEFTVR